MHFFIFSLSANALYDFHSGIVDHRYIFVICLIYTRSNGMLNISKRKMNSHLYLEKWRGWDFNQLLHNYDCFGNLSKMKKYSTLSNYDVQITHNEITYQQNLRYRDPHYSHSHLNSSLYDLLHEYHLSEKRKNYVPDTLDFTN